jgi:hypothetical protein
MRIVSWSLYRLRDKRSFLCIPLMAGTLAAILSLLSCGGGSSSSPPPPPPTADFSLVFENASVSLQQQGVYQSQTLTAKPANGFTGTISETVSGLPANVTMTPGSLPALVITGPGQSSSTFQLAASQAAAVGFSTITVTGTSASLSHSATFSLAVTAVAPFAIQVSPTSLSLTPASSASVEVSVTANAGTSPSLGVQVSQAPANSGTNIYPANGVLTLTNPLSFAVAPGVLAQPLQSFPIVVTASDNENNSSVAVVPLTVSAGSSSTTPTRSTYARTDQDPTGVVYDQARKLLFVSVEALNQVAVLSSVDGHRVATIPVQYPAGIDESVDGTAVYVVSPYFSYITTIDPNSLQVVQQTSLPSNAGSAQTAVQVATLSTSEVMIFLGNNLNPPAYIWNPATNGFTGFGQVFQGFGQVITRSADHSKVLIYGTYTSLSEAILYDAASGNLTGPANLNWIYDLAISPNGSQIIGIGLQNQPTEFYDNQFNVLGSLSLSAFPVQGAIYSLDGSHVYVLETDLSSQSTIAAMINTGNFSLVGVVPSFLFGTSIPFSGFSTTPFAIDETNMIFGGVLPGMGYLDASSPGSLSLPFSPGSLMSPALDSLSAPTSSQLSGPNFSSDWKYAVYFGAPPASPQTQQGTNVSVQAINVLDVTAPAGTVAGPANVTLTRSDGFFQVLPDAMSYGPTVLQVDANAGPPAGGNSIKVVGYGFGGSNAQVTIGGKPATNIGFIGPTGFTTLPTETLTLTTPSGTSGYADIVVSTPDGSTTVSGGFQYVTSAQIYAAPGAFDDIVYDQTRQRLYISNQNNNRIEIFDLGTKAYLSPISVGNQPTALALTPDGARLGVVNSVDLTMSVVDPSALQVLSTFTLLPAQDTACNVPLNMSAAEPHRILVNMACPGALGGGVFRLANLDTGSLSCTGVAGCQSNGVDMSFWSDSGLGALASTPDGTKIVFVPDSGFIDPVGILNLTANTLTYGFSGSWNDAAADSDANAFAASFGIANALLSQAAIMAYEPYADAGNQSLNNVIGEKLNPSGSLLFVPQKTGVDIFDVHTGRLAQHVVLPEGIPLDMNAMALDETGTKMFLISNSGITITQLFQAPLSLASVNPATGSAGTQVTLRGSGFLNGATVLFGTSQAATAYVNAETLTATVPTISAGPVRITVTNPGGQTYSFDDAFTVQ